jgi:hypothetical protein
MRWTGDRAGDARQRMSRLEATGRKVRPPYCTGGEASTRRRLPWVSGGESDLQSLVFSIPPSVIYRSSVRHVVGFGGLPGEGVFLPERGFLTGRWMGRTLCVSESSGARAGGAACMKGE